MGFSKSTKPNAKRTQRCVAEIATLWIPQTVCNLQSLSNSISNSKKSDFPCIWTMTHYWMKVFLVLAHSDFYFISQILNTKLNTAKYFPAFFKPTFLLPLHFQLFQIYFFNNVTATFKTKVNWTILPQLFAVFSLILATNDLASKEKFSGLHFL